MKSETEQLSFARLDLSREQRCGFPEFIFGEGKTPEQILEIMLALQKKGIPAFATRLKKEAIDFLKKNLPSVELDLLAGTAFLSAKRTSKKKGSVAVVCAGTSDLPVAQEALNTLKVCGFQAELFADAGIAGLHRLLEIKKKIVAHDIAIAVAGMEGALPSVLGGLIRNPVIAVPASVGYGASFQGMAALLAMLNSCASGITVVNIDNGFGAACAAIRILNTFNKNKE